MKTSQSAPALVALVLFVVLIALAIMENLP